MNSSDEVRCSDMSHETIAWPDILNAQQILGQSRGSKGCCMMFFHNFCLVHATVAEHLTGINKIYPISGLCSGAYLLALGHLSSFRSVLWFSFNPRDKVRVRTSESSNSTKKTTKG